MAGSIVLRSYMDLVNGPLENTVDYSNSGITQEHTSMRRFTQRIGALEYQTNSGADDLSKGFWFELQLSSSEAQLEENIAERMSTDAKATKLNSLSYNRTTDLAKYCIDFEEDMKSPRYLSFFNLDDKPVYICKKANVTTSGSDSIYTLIPFLEIPANRSIGPIVFNAKHGNIFAVVGTTEADANLQDLYVIAYDK